MDLEYVDIDPHHTKAEIVKIISHSNIDIVKPYDQTKTKLYELLSHYLLNCSHEIYFFIPLPFTNREEFIVWLGQQPVKLSIAERNQITLNAKEIIAYCKSGYDLSKSKYDSYEEVESECIKIKDHGNLTCVRTCLKLFNLTRNADDRIVCKLPHQLNNQLQLKNEYHKRCIPTFRITRGKYKIDFS